MTITLTIDSVDALPDGGPISYQVRNRGFEIGRQQHLDWTLPDPTRHISGLHCDVRFEKGGYFLYDVSSNGTFLNGSSSRMKSPHRLVNGDRLTIGPYVVRVEVEGASGPSREAVQEHATPPRAPAASPFPPSGGDIWDTGAPAPPPIDRRELMPEPEGRRRAADYSNQFVDFPDMKPEPLPQRPAAIDPFADSSQSSDPFAVSPTPAGPEPLPYVRQAPFGLQPNIDPDPLPVPRPMPRPVQPPDQAVARARAVPVESEPFAMAPAAIPVVPVPPPFPSPAAPVGGGQDLSRFVAGLATGAGVQPETFLSRDPAEVGHEIGLFLRTTVEQLAQLLRARAAAKAMTKSSSRTMIGATDNNPLKFIPAPAEIIDVMFTRKRPGYLGGKASLEAGFGDLKRHELATWTAMQKALSRLLDDFSPEAISAKAGGSVLSSKKGRSWDLFVERWESKTESHENGMLDVFLGYFAEAYDEANKKS